MTEKSTVIPVSGSPGRFRTAQRPGQSGEQAERKAGPSPLSRHPTGPHAPYESQDIDGLAAMKHDVSKPETAGPRKGR